VASRRLCSGAAAPQSVSNCETKTWEDFVTPTLFFHDWTITSARDGISDYGHTFGGHPAHAGAKRENCNDRLLHLLHRINLEDPLINLRIPNVQWLPLYYCFDFRVNEFGYRLTSDQDLQVFFWPNEVNISETESYPGDNFPSHFGRTGIMLDRFPYDPTDRDDAYQMAAVFGLDKLSPDDRAWILEHEADECESLLGHRPESEEETLKSLSHPFAQGRPNSRCPNPNCANNGKPGNVDVIALMPAEPVPGVHTFGQWGDDVELIFELCPRCQTIHVSNQCS
jgi:hypothetical protein